MYPLKLVVIDIIDNRLISESSVIVNKIIIIQLKPFIMHLKARKIMQR